MADTDRGIAGHSPNVSAWARWWDCRSSTSPASPRWATTSSTVGPEEQDTRLRANEEFLELLHDHACEGMYGAPEYLGNRNMVGWNYIDFAGDVQPRGYTDEEVSQP